MARGDLPMGAMSAISSAAAAAAVSAVAAAADAIILKSPAPAKFELPNRALRDLISDASAAALLEWEASAEASSAAISVQRSGLARIGVFVDAGSSRLQLRDLSASSDLEEEGSPPGNPIAWAVYNNSMRQTGWGHLSVATTENADISSDVKMYAAGLAEGYLTAQQIEDFRHNADILMQSDEDRHHALGNIKDLFGRSVLTVCNKSGLSPGAQLSQSQSQLEGGAWSAQGRFALMQAWGILDAFNERAKTSLKAETMSLVDLLILNSDGETPELEMAYDSEEFLLRQSQHDNSSTDDSAEAFLQRATHRKREKGANLRSTDRRARELQDLDEGKWRKIKASGGRCSALVRLTANNADLMVGHTTFSDYGEMTRIFKYYDFPLGENVVRRMGFSSYPGVAGSTDDYYLLDSGLVITETTISMLTDEPYDKLDDSKSELPDFMRIMVANRLARSGREWVDLMTKSSTGTYSSQWMVVDYTSFKPGSGSLEPGTLMVLEQVPGMSKSADMTKTLQDTGFWASENRAWFKEIRDFMGASEAEELHGSLFSASDNPRAKIFKATAPEVQSLEDMRRELRRNRSPHEGALSAAESTPDHAIAARGDLLDDSRYRSTNGGVDSKVTNACLARSLRCQAISGPSADDQKPFSWVDPKTGAELFPGSPHQGM
eukprot:CAMPEP_0206465068 /NCGR_PEP_ID=MMETSP0324_2-20121206/27600_1 /ASSEMBLY_ACC=CAM_ASM_000836 /TAXON_ID=2866 /ORGANISM="Crypthecodinium cohnii, Strain Seligo" /LENGTH=663 /DNA_ID=CAMNT_0053937837 /DNA_START=47 /DNA_END=2036 /DNA_ORIENTATION=+